jgi:hypothetical protein
MLPLAYQRLQLLLLVQLERLKIPGSAHRHEEHFHYNSLQRYISYFVNNTYFGRIHASLAFAFKQGSKTGPRFELGADANHAMPTTMGKRKYGQGLSSLRNDPSLI